jgi:2-iminobutanoate/2-iminopropanoate deaminase
MSKQAIGGDSDQGLPFSKAIRAGDFIYLSGQVAFDAKGRLNEGGIEDQTHQTMANIISVLKMAGCELSDVIKVNVWLDDARDFSRFNTTYATYFTSDPPARSTVESKLMIDARIEIDCVAYKPL